MGNFTFFSKIYCSVVGHDYRVTRRVTYHVKEYTCKHCNKELTTNCNGNLVSLTPKYREINNVLMRIYNNRVLRANRKLRQVKQGVKLLSSA